MCAHLRPYFVNIHSIFRQHLRCTAIVLIRLEQTAPHPKTSPPGTSVFPKKFQKKEKCPKKHGQLSLFEEHWKRAQGQRMSEWRGAGDRCRGARGR